MNKKKESKVVPNVRFKGFTDDWKQRKLGDVCEVTMGQSPDGSTYSDEPSDYILVQGNADLKDGWVVPRVWTSQKTKTAQAGDLIMSVRAPVGAMGKTAYDIVIGRGVAAIKGNEFIYQTLVKYDADGHWKKLAAGSTFESVNSNEVKGAIINVPQDIEEQKKIGEYFLNLDHLITLHQQKITRLIKLKKAMLEKMFPKKGSVIPEIRFNGFANAWEQRKLGELVGIYDGVHQTPNYQDSGIMFLSVENIATLKSEKYIAEEAFEIDYKVYPEKGDILMTRIGDVGTTNVVETVEKVAFYVSLALLKPNGIDSYFLSNAMKTNAFQKGLRKRTLVTAIPQKINKDEIGKIDIFITNNDEEQKKIGEYFLNLDHLITLHQRRIDMLKKLKSACLSEMFI
ncbi:restriction endonuclease subunit S [Ligilactobacillus ruminis]|uniref:restriction endonuclease subunit S n=1 Tax=Ligilactobacillus ruminis TaxID=1623 RepID=UPI001472B1C5|nr:restriction endonuclease subunit S [Ligilactobacillus ruminis]NME32375.1 restriction endonuclease subunit S [Ligilactobacillus ruminis]